jgi:hypothetical protein
MEIDSDLLEGPYIVLVLDASESAAELWPQISEIASTLWEVASDVYVLGCNTPLRIEEPGDSLLPFPLDKARHCSLIAPIMDRLLRQSRTLDALIIVGNGQVWDLEDWVDCPLVRQWLLLQVGGESLQPSRTRMPEYRADQLESALDSLRSPFEPAPQPYSGATSFWTSTEYSWQIDRAGFPLVYVDPLRSYVHLFPVAKAQFEQYLWQDNPPEWGDARYADLIACNPRAAPADIDSVGYERLFLTGILPAEIHEFARWLGRGYDLLKADEWLTVRQWLSTQEATAAPPSVSDMGLSCISADIWLTLWARLTPTSMLELSLQQAGLVEWTYGSSAGRSNRYVGMGHPRSGFFPTVKGIEEPLIPINQERRMRHFGFRLKRRA